MLKLPKDSNKYLNPKVIKAKKDEIRLLSMFILEIFRKV